MRVVSSATGALEIALRLCGIGPGDEVLTASMTFFAAPNMIVKVGATPVSESNLADNTCLWVSIGPQSGRVTTAENAYNATSATPVPTAREFAQSGQAMGGR